MKTNITRVVGTRGARRRRRVSGGEGYGSLTGQTSTSRRSDSIRIEEPGSFSGVHATSRRHESREFGSKEKLKKPVDGKTSFYGRPVGFKSKLKKPMSISGAGSHSQTGSGDAMADMDGVLRNTTMLRDITDDDDDDYEYNSSEDFSEEEEDEDVDEDEDDDDGHGDGVDVGVDVGYNVCASVNAEECSEEVSNSSSRKWIKRQGRKFACQTVHRSAKQVLDQHFDGDWVTFRKVPLNMRKDMFNIFRTKWRWDPRDNQDVYEGFINVLKDRYRDHMRELRVQSKNKAREFGHRIADDEHKFEITCNFPPDTVPLEKWQRLCKIWNTKRWLKKSKVGRANRSKEAARHTGGSMGFDEHRIHLEKLNKGAVPFGLVFIDTHATTECKKRLRAGEIDVDDLDELEFVTERSKKSYMSYMRELQRLYGKDHGRDLEDRDDLAVWKSVHPNYRSSQMFGVGLSDPHFVVTGASSTSCGSTSYRLQSQEVQDVRSQLRKEREAREDLERRLEQMRKDREQEREQERAEREQERVERDRERAERDLKEQKLQKQFEEILKNIARK